MPAFVANGPDIPERLLQAHEEGRVVFFCGAGISYPAGLPGFRGLVKAIYDQLGASPNDVQQTAIKTGQFDIAIGLLEADIVGGREVVRNSISQILTPVTNDPKATDTHMAMLTLARTRDGRTRLITTNFDRLFEEIIASTELNIQRFIAPLLPIPKNRWDGLVYLHGLLPSTPRASELDRLVISSGDFGLAYLTERWAARFVSELFRNYSVCFVGYSINDPVLRYMMDALAADRLLGEFSPEMFAFGSYPKGKKKQVTDEWQAKNVTPILYREHNKHTYLHKTLQEWASTYRDGVRGKEMIIAQHASTPPLAASRSDYAVGRVLWALTDSLAAKHFAGLNPVPPLKWLEALSENQFGHHDLSRFEVTANNNTDKELSFSMIRRPAPYTHSPRMCIVDGGTHRSGWDDVIPHLARWLTRHLDDPELIIWLVNQGGQLHERFAGLIRDQLEKLNQLDIEGKQEELDRIRAAAPKAIPDQSMRTLWQLLLSGRVRSHTRYPDLYNWFRRIRQDGITLSLRLELREILMPCVTLHAPFHRREAIPDPSRQQQIKDLVDWEIKLSCDDVHSALSDSQNMPEWQVALPDLLQDFTVLLRDAQDLKRELGGVDNKSDLSYIYQPSIDKHPQNKDFYDWTTLIELTREAWLATAQIDPARARHAAEGWWQVPYPLFKRLALFAAAQGDVISQKQALDWLLAEGGWWLWSVETQREAIRLLVALSPKLDDSETTKLEQAILAGPPLGLFKEDIDEENLRLATDLEMWLRLAKLQAARVVLDQEAKTQLDKLTQQYPQWQLAEDERDEFPFWMGSGEESIFEAPPNFELAPSSRRELVIWLQKYPNSAKFFHQDGWRERCRDDFPAAACALRALARKNIWLADRWREALQIWSEDKLTKRSWRYMGPLLQNTPDDFVKSLAHDLSWWLQSIANTFVGHEVFFLNLCHRLLAMDYQDEIDSDSPVMQAINHPVGHVTEAMLRWWYRKLPEDGQGLPEELKPIFTDLCDTRINKYRHGRVLLATHVVALYRVDRDWAMSYLLPLFDWQCSLREARSAWQGFLGSPRLYKPLLSAIKQPLLETAAHYEELGEYGEQFATFLTFVALDRGDTFTVKEMAKSVRCLPAKGLKSSAQTLVQAIKSAGDQRGDYWHNRILPYLHNIWLPKSRDLITLAISESLARLCVAADESFPEALRILRHWLQPVPFPDFLVHLIHEAKLCNRYPADSLTYLATIIDDNAQWLPRKLQDCLKDIERTNQQLTYDTRFIRLAELVRKHNLT